MVWPDGTLFVEGVSREGLGYPQVKVHGPAHLMVRDEASDSETVCNGIGAGLRITRVPIRLQLFAIKKPRMNRNVKRVSPGSA